MSILFLHECLILQVKLHVVDLVERLFGGLSLPDIGDQITDDVLDCLIPDFSFASQLLSQSLLNLPKLHLIMVISLLEGGSSV